MKNLGVIDNQEKINVSDVELDLPAPSIQEKKKVKNDLR